MPLLITLVNGDGEFVAQWKEGEFPDFIARHLAEMPNANRSFLYQLRVEDGRNIPVMPGNLAIQVYTTLLERRLV